MFVDHLIDVMPDCNMPEEFVFDPRGKREPLEFFEPRSDMDLTIGNISLGAM